MKKLIAVVALLAACSPNGDNTPNATITAFESNLLPVVSFEGERGWNIQERMQHYGVPGDAAEKIKELENVPE